MADVAVVAVVAVVAEVAVVAVVAVAALPVILPLIEFVIPETFHEEEYEVYLFSMLPKLIPQL